MTDDCLDSENIKIAHITTVHPRGDVRIFHKECAYLQSSEVGEVTLLVADGKGTAMERGVAVVDVGQLCGGRLGRVLLGNLAMWREVRKLTPSVVHIHDPELLLLGYLLRRRGLLVIYDMHENFPKQILTKEWLPRAFREFVAGLAQKLEKWILPEMAVIFAEKSYPSDYLWIRNSAVVLNLPDLEALGLTVPWEFHKATVGYIGGVTKQRGAIVALEAIRQLRTEGIDLEFECIGPVSKEVVDHELYVSSQQEGWGRFPGRLPAAVGWDRIGGCVCGLAILGPSPNYVESLPTKVLEYMALGLPVILSDFPLYRGVVEEAGCGLVVDPIDSHAVAGAIRWLLKHPDEAAQMGRRGLEAVRARYSWSAEAERLGAFYRDQLRNR